MTGWMRIAERRCGQPKDTVITGPRPSTTAECWDPMNMEIFRFTYESGVEPSACSRTETEHMPFAAQPAR